MVLSAFRIRTTGFEKGQRAVGLILSDMAEEAADEITEFFGDAKERMRQRMKPWATEDGELYKGFRTRIITQLRVRGRTGSRGYLYRVDFRNVAPYASVMEFGTDERYVYVRDKPKFIEWLDTRRTRMEFIFGKTKDTVKWVKIGGKNSSIKLGNSERKFFFPVIDEMISKGALDDISAVAVNEAIKKFRTR